MSGTESDSDSYFSPDQSPLITAHSSGGSNPHPIAHPHGHAQNHNYSLSFGLSTSASSKPLSSIAERRSASGDEETDEDEDGDEEWYHEQHPEDNAGKHQDEESVIKTGYLWKKGERRKVSGLNLLMFMPPEMSVRLGRNGGLYFGLLNLPSTNLLRSISYCGFWIFPMFTLAPPSN